MAALAEELGQLSSTARSAYAEAERLRESIAEAEEARDRDVAGLVDLEHRLELRGRNRRRREPDPAERDRLAEEARLARGAEMDARPRCGPSRNGHAPSLVEPMRYGGRRRRTSGAPPRDRRRERLVREARTAAAVHAGRPSWHTFWNALAVAARERSQAETMRTEAGRAERGADIGALPDAGLRVVRRRAPSR